MEPKVLLVYPPPQLMPTELPRPDYSLGPLYLAGALERAGIEVDLLDSSVGTTEDNLDQTFNQQVMQDNGLIRVGMTTERIREVIARGGYNIVGVHSNFTPQTKMALEVAQAAKSVSEDILVMAGGINARALPERFLTGGVDVVCNTEGERVIVELVHAWEKKAELTPVTGTITMRDGRIVHQHAAPLDTLKNLDELPYPAWHKLVLSHYRSITQAAGRDSSQVDGLELSMQTSRGCWADCEYCHISVEGAIGTLRFKSVDRVVEEVSRLIGLGVTGIYLEDDTLLANKPLKKQIFTKFREMKLRLKDVNGVNLLHFRKRVGNRTVIDEEFLELLCGAGLTRIVFPVESASQRIIDKYATGKLPHKFERGKLINPDGIDVVELVKTANRLGIVCPINMMIGFPDETEDEIRSSIELGKRLVDAGAPYCSLYITIPFPGSKLYDTALREGYLAPDFNTDAFNWRKPVMRNTTVSPERIEELQKEGWMSINPPDYVRKRLEMDIGKRWKSGEPETA